jgi:transcription elongation factor GreA-like protein
MATSFPKDFLEFISSFNTHNVEYLVVGGYSVLLHGYPRTTGDIDIWVNRTEKNYDRIRKAFGDFGMPLFDMTRTNFLYHENWDVFSFGRSPMAIDIMVEVKGLDFNSAFNSAVLFDEQGISIRTLSRENLIIAKKAVMRPKDQDDLMNL